MLLFTSLPLVILSLLLSILLYTQNLYVQCFLSPAGPVASWPPPPPSRAHSTVQSVSCPLSQLWRRHSPSAVSHVSPHSALQPPSPFAAAQTARGDGRGASSSTPRGVNVSFPRLWYAILVSLHLFFFFQVGEVSGMRACRSPGRLHGAPAGCLPLIDGQLTTLRRRASIMASSVGVRRRRDRRFWWCVVVFRGRRPCAHAFDVSVQPVASRPVFAVSCSPWVFGWRAGYSLLLLRLWSLLLWCWRRRGWLLRRLCWRGGLLWRRLCWRGGLLWRRRCRCGSARQRRSVARTGGCVARDRPHRAAAGVAARVAGPALRARPLDP